MSKSESGDFGKFLNTHTVQIERVFPYPIETVFDYFSKQELLSTWLMPATVELRAGGRIQLKSDPIPESVGVQPHEETHECRIRGLISEFVPQRVIAYCYYCSLAFPVINANTFDNLSLAPVSGSPR